MSSLVSLETLTLLDQSPTLMTSINFSYFHKDTVSKYSRIRGQGFSMNFWGEVDHTLLVHNTFTNDKTLSPAKCPLLTLSILIDWLMTWNNPYTCLLQNLCTGFFLSLEYMAFSQPHGKLPHSSHLCSNANFSIKSTLQPIYNCYQPLPAPLVSLSCSLFYCSTQPSKILYKELDIQWRLRQTGKGNKSLMRMAATDPASRAGMGLGKSGSETRPHKS